MSDPLSHVASWIAPAAANLSITAADVDDPLIALIRERARLYRLAGDLTERADKILAALPDDVRFEIVRVSFLGLAGDEDFQTEKELSLFFSVLKAAAAGMAFSKKLDQAVKDQNKARVNHLKAKALDEFRVGLKRIREVREASGCEALYREAEALEEQADELEDRICDTPAGSFDALLWQLELSRDNAALAPRANEDLLDTIIAGVKRLARTGGFASSASTSPHEGRTEAAKSRG
jgi:hypothetical protein